MVRIDKERCIGCGICQGVCPDGFEIVNGKSEVKNGNADCVKEAAEACPKNAIILNDNTSETHQPGLKPKAGFGGGIRRRGMQRGRGRHKFN